MNPKYSEYLQLIIIGVIIFAIYKIMKGLGFFGFDQSVLAPTPESKEQIDFTASSSKIANKILFDSLTETERNNLFKNWTKNTWDAFIKMKDAKYANGTYTDIITNIINSKRLVNDLEDQLIEQFRRIGSIQELFEITKAWKWYVDNHGDTYLMLWHLQTKSNLSNMGAYLTSFMDGTDYKRLTDVLDKLPNYTA